MAKKKIVKLKAKKTKKLGSKEKFAYDIIDFNGKLVRTYDDRESENAEELAKEFVKKNGIKFSLKKLRIITIPKKTVIIPAHEEIER